MLYARCEYVVIATAIVHVLNYIIFNSRRRILKLFALRAKLFIKYYNVHSLCIRLLDVCPQADAVSRTFTTVATINNFRNLRNILRARL